MNKKEKVVSRIRKKVSESKRVIAVIILLVVVFTGSAAVVFGTDDTYRPFQDLKKGLESPRTLHRLFEFSETVKNEKSDWIAGGGLFLIFGKGHSESQEYVQIKVDMAFERPDLPDTYAIVELPLEKINVKFQEEENSTVAFSIVDKQRNGNELARWKQIEAFNLYERDIQTFLDQYLAYAVITTREENWPKNIEMPLDREDYP